MNGRTRRNELRAAIVFGMSMGTLVGPVAAEAGIVTWDMRGTITTANGSVFGMDGIVVGETFAVRLRFDSDAALLRTQSGGDFSPGVRYEFDPAATVMTVAVGTRAPVELLHSTVFGQSDLLWVRNDAGDQIGNDEPVSDGYSWRLAASPVACGGSTVTPTASVIFRGPVLDLVTGPQLPTVPDHRLADLPVSNLQLFGSTGCDPAAYVVGDITSIEVHAASAEELLSALMTQIAGMALPTGIGNALNSKLQSALGDALAGDFASASATLHALIKSVEAQRGKKLTYAQADQLVSAVQAIIAVVGRP